MRRLTRRTFAGLIAASGAVLAAVCVAVLPLAPEERLRRLIRSRLDYLRIPEPVLDAFVRDYMADPANRVRHVASLRYTAQRAAYSVPIVATRLPVHRFERHIISQFLQSTDFFREGSKVERTLQYAGYCDPYRLGCANYLARLG